MLTLLLQNCTHPKCVRGGDISSHIRAKRLLCPQFHYVYNSAIKVVCIQNMVETSPSWWDCDMLAYLLAHSKGTLPHFLCITPSWQSNSQCSNPFALRLGYNCSVKFGVEFWVQLQLQWPFYTQTWWGSHIVNTIELWVQLWAQFRGTMFVHFMGTAWVSTHEWLL